VPWFAQVATATEATTLVWIAVGVVATLRFANHGTQSIVSCVTKN
jgi:hypothetical protein